MNTLDKSMYLIQYIVTFNRVQTTSYIRFVISTVSYRHPKDVPCRTVGDRASAISVLGPHVMLGKQQETSGEGSKQHMDVPIGLPTSRFRATLALEVLNWHHLRD
jgi:hypothetical protein